VPEEEIEVKIRIKGPIGVTQPFKQGGVWRLTIPKKAVKQADLEAKAKEFFAYVFVETDKGLLLVPLTKVVNTPNLKEALDFIDVSNLTNKDLEMLFEEDNTEAT
jgi:hypothetical protein